MKRVLKYMVMAAVVLVSAVSCRLAGREFEQTQPLCITNLVLELPGTIADFDTDNFVAGYTDKFYEHIRIDSSNGWEAHLEAVELVPDVAKPDMLVPAIDAATGEWVSALNENNSVYAPDWCYLENSTGGAGMTYCHMIYDQNLSGGLRYVKFVVVGSGVRKVINITQKAI
ncbi:MAG: hypothetical protein IKA70_02620 [Alistipes sp.]|nr:hypothetical protein [Alistipes sp.]